MLLRRLEHRKNVLKRKHKEQEESWIIGQTVGSLSVYLHYYCCDVCLPGQCLPSLELANSIVASKLPMIVWHWTLAIELNKTLNKYPYIIHHLVCIELLLLINTWACQSVAKEIVCSVQRWVPVTALNASMLFGHAENF